MIRSALEFLRELIGDGTRPELVKTDDPRRQLLIAPKTSTGYEWVTVPPRLRDHKVATLESFVAATAAGDNPRVWVDGDETVAVLDDGDRRDLVHWPLDSHPIFHRLSEIDAQREWLTQFAFLRLLRLDLDMPEQTLAPFRRLDWRKSANATVTAGHGDERLGREVMAAVNSPEGLPDRLVVNAPVWSNAPCDVEAIMCNVDIDPEQHNLRLVPQPDALAAAERRQTRKLAETIIAALPDVPVLIGRP